MVRMDEREDALSLVTRLARPRALLVLAALLAAPALVAGSRQPAVSAPLAAASVALLVVGGRAMRTRIGAGRVTVVPAVPFARGASRLLADFDRAGVETVGEARARRAEARARAYAARTGTALPDWLRAPAGAGLNDHLRRLVLVPRAGEPLPLTAWLPPEDDLGPALRAVEARLR
ncbi:hypothetical protein [Anaeromyxobacter oryzisoli]|uniref:hypothetical protein n=1 Tax=Anaeromyxobacter oryzisoli TaxID=2925408 RepID=UPI001F5A499A|nr:hypothetical protein [Anaeromyxobacter sp. SG63]